MLSEVRGVDLCGSLEHLGLASVARVLAGLGTSGRLSISQDRWVGEVFFDRGTISAASFGAERGLAAAEAIALALPTGRFAFGGGAPPHERNIELPTEELLAHLEVLLARREGWARAVPSLLAVPRLASSVGRPVPAERTDGHVALDRSTIQALLSVDGRRTILELAGTRPLVQVAEELSTLLDLGLICIEAPAKAAPGRDSTGRDESGAPVVAPLAAAPPPAPIPRHRAPRIEGAQTGGEAPALSRSSAGAPEPQPSERTIRAWIRPLTLAAIEAGQTGGEAPAPSRSNAGSPRRRPRASALRSWLRPLALAAVALVLLAVTSWDQVGGPRPLRGLAPVGRAAGEAPQNARSRPPSLGGTLLPAAAAAPAAGAPRPPPAAAAAAGAAVPRATVPLLTVFDERFADNHRNWPDDPQSTAWLVEGGYHLFARQPAQFVAIGSPVAGRLRDVVVTGTFRKVGGPPGGGYGLIVRDHGPGPRDGVHQGGRYYVLAVGDRGEFGIWRREEDRWIDLAPWTPSEAVRPGGAPNVLTARAVGQHLTLLVNGVEVATRLDAAPLDGGVGVFAGGDFNAVVLDRLAVQVPT